MASLCGWLARRCKRREQHVTAPAWPSPLAGQKLIDLTDDWALTFALLDDTRSWRERAVHELVLRDSDHVDTTSTYQIRIPLELVRRFEPSAEVGDNLHLLLPFMVRTKELLLNVDFRGPSNNPATLLLRREAAEVQAQYLAHVDGHPLEEQPLGGALWVGVSAYTTSAWREALAMTKPFYVRHLRPPYRRSWQRKAIAHYLNINSEAHLGITTRQVAG